MSLNSDKSFKEFLSPMCRALFRDGQVAAFFGGDFYDKDSAIISLDRLTNSGKNISKYRGADQYDVLAVYEKPSNGTQFFDPSAKGKLLWQTHDGLEADISFIRTELSVLNMQIAQEEDVISKLSAKLRVKNIQAAALTQQLKELQDESI